MRPPVVLFALLLVALGAVILVRHRAQQTDQCRAHFPNFNAMAECREGRAQ